MNVFCFAEREHAEEFRKRFGGEFIDPKKLATIAAAPRYRRSLPLTAQSRRRKVCPQSCLFDHLIGADAQP
jgi:hypothetical protein